MARFFQPKKKTQLNTKHQSLTIEKLDHHGAGMAYQNKKPIFIEGALPGEQVLAQLTESKSKFARAKLIKIQKASEQRIAPFCQHYAECGGCNMQHLSVEAQQEYKQQTLSQLMSKFAGQSVALSAPVVGDERGYRRRARVSIKLNKKTCQLEFGFRKKQSKDIVTVTHCPVLDTELDNLLAPLYDLLSGFSNQENIGHVELVKGDNTKVIVLRHLKALKESEQKLLEQFAAENQASLYLMPESDQLNRVVGESAHYLEAGVTIPFEPNNFIQVNQNVNQTMVEQALSWLELSEQDRVLDLFCGLGNFSLPMAKQVASVVGVEGVDVMVEKAANNAQVNGINNTAFYQANLEQDVSGQPWAAENFDKILLDPARAGASGIIEQISALGASRVVYVSCNPATLARDSQSLLNQGYKLQKLGMLDMFPHTSHLESMALFVKD
ncbi:23S rRNA (uracil(1939)-C(5))-methyltransferase RlmD [Vibrio europaeus]|uniref:23S rRNA (uracil(1939)-C(5))-methyltransferase RlmD n=1 Tax=Vibrio europaeus TaxID=300876 RepID=A0A178JIV4_9VIBR|nr:23S rRNA (uracil(1939)-C(5))-methyltransferase RlmD [Vibrio europaeus]MDC5704507.1 23S rRNA (uracil(1939)-C(5))-methyltransferase RlmD [Vibrio europaeus]MDC5709137.1 23S rRNA (uracil(1939)-C(5))-methyltransferase RlmD [Vibrio europaeus]MDC5717523.1 23S rRNA (uracil(1939)-C(5))-methyltransferase RlmD [Vibrio europaeus]MDC5718592.1 23S rRNA (uracil(1939)-C(5))-methyltransferase RlmD [Vibrio europaeus]MDC5727976.1 23S rRNA (uracil(1939)-C(5))-methyltransferase RlmD [Vibrio europaeus]